MKLIAILYVLACCIGTTIGQTVLQGKTQAQQGDMALSQAAIRAKSFLALLNISDGEVSHYKGMLMKQYGAWSGRRKWYISTSTAKVSVDSQSGLIVAYSNSKRTDDRYRGRGRTGRKFTTSETVARQHLRDLATRFGVPTSAIMATYTMKGDGQGQDTNPQGHFGCVFKDSAGQIIATLACDLQDGAVLEYTRSR